jgi:hypothetical protein
LIEAGTLGDDVSSMLTGYVADKEEAKASALDFDGIAAGDTVEAVEDALVLVWRKAQAGVYDTESGPCVVGDSEGTADMDSTGGVFDGVVKKVEDSGAEVFCDALNVESDRAGDGLENNGLGGKVVPLEGDGDAIGDKRGEIDEGAVLLAVLLTELASFEDLLDGGEETVRIGEHDGVELLTLGFVDGASLEGLEIETDACNWCLEFVGDGIEEGILTFITADLADEEDGVEDDASNEDREEDDPEDGQGNGALVEDDPADVQGDGEADEEYAQRNEGGDGSAASSDVHLPG